MMLKNAYEKGNKKLEQARENPRELEELDIVDYAKHLQETKVF